MPAIEYSTDVDVASVAQTRALLARFEPDLMKRLDQRLNAVARDIKSTAQNELGKTGVTGVAYRIRTRSSKGKFVKSVTTAAGSVARGQRWSTEPGVLAAIFELANAVRNALPQNVERTKNLITSLNERYGPPGRFLWAAWDVRKGFAMRDVENAIREIEEEYSARMEGAA